jgi:superfamily II DNA or RNA helicase
MSNLGSKLANLRPHQEQALSLLRQSVIGGHRRPMVQAPTGAGKTVLAAAVVDGARRKRNRVLFVVPAVSLVDQTVEEFYAEGLRDVGVIQGDHCMTDWSQPIQIASVQTLMRRKLPEAQVAIIDEAHRWFKFYGRWMSDQAWAQKPIIGLSATPWTKGLGKHYDDLIIAATTSELIEAGYLSRFRVFAPSHPDLSDVRTVAGDYHEGDLSEAMNKTALVADIVETWLKRGERRPTLCFGVDRAHAKNLQQQFEAAGVRTGYIDAFTGLDERKAIERKFHAGEIEVVCNVGCLTTGVDWDVRCIILARPTKSEMLFVQIIGRGLRTAEGKGDCLIFDHTDTHLRLGFVTDIHHTELDDGTPIIKSKRRKVPLPKECPACHFVKPAKVHACPCCGFKPERISAVEVADGELCEINRRRERASLLEKQRWYSMLLAIVEERGYQRGWAANKYRQRFNEWPRGLVEIPAEPTPEVLSFVRSRLIAYAKRRDRAA